MSKLQKKIMSKLQKKNMSKLQKNISIIFFLFFIYYLISKNFSLKFREGFDQCKSGTKGRYKRYQNNKNGTTTKDCLHCIGRKKRTRCLGIDFRGWEEGTCKSSGCKRAWPEQTWDIPADDIWDENKNPCMTKPFCKNCKTCKDEGKLGQVDGEKTIGLKDGTDFDCEKCVPEKVDATGDDDSKKCKGTQFLFFCFNT